jgi:hypothetical protein
VVLKKNEGGLWLTYRNGAILMLDINIAWEVGVSWHRDHRSTRLPGFLSYMFLAQEIDTLPYPSITIVSVASF